VVSASPGVSGSQFCVSAQCCVGAQCSNNTLTIRLRLTDNTHYH